MAIKRVIVDGVQVGAYAEEENVLRTVKRNLRTAQRIIIEKCVVSLGKRLLDCEHVKVLSKWITRLDEQNIR